MRQIKAVRGGSRFRFYSTVAEGFTSDEMTFDEVMKYIDRLVEEAKEEYDSLSKYRAGFITRYYKPDKLSNSKVKE